MIVFIYIVVMASCLGLGFYMLESNADREKFLGGILMAVAFLCFLSLLFGESKVVSESTHISETIKGTDCIINDDFQVINLNEKFGKDIEPGTVIIEKKYSDFDFFGFRLGDLVEIKHSVKENQ